MTDKQAELHLSLFERRSRVVAAALEDGLLPFDARRVFMGVVALPLLRGVHEGAARTPSFARL